MRVRGQQSLSEDWRRLSLFAGSFLKTWQLARWRLLCKHPTFRTIWSNEFRHLKRHPSCFYSKLSSESKPWHTFNRGGFRSWGNEIWSRTFSALFDLTSPIFIFSLFIHCLSVIRRRLSDTIPLLDLRELNKIFFQPLV